MTKDASAKCSNPAFARKINVPMQSAIQSSFTINVGLDDLGHENVNNPLYSVGGANLYATSICSATLNCCTRKMEYRCVREYQMKDKFEDIFSLKGRGYPFKQYPEELVGTPYDITASWKESDKTLQRTSF